METTTVLMTGCGVMGEPYLRAAGRRGVDVALVETPERIEALRRVHPCVVASLAVPGPVAHRDEAWVAPALELAAQVRPDAVVPFAEGQVLAAAAVQRARGLRGTGFDAAVISRNKALQRAVLTDPALRHPVSRVAAPLAAAAHWDDPGLPVVVKPLSSTGSEGVELVRDAAAWRETLERRSSEAVLVEQFVEDQEYSWEALVRDGRVLLDNVTRKTTTGPPEFVELVHEVGFEHRDPGLGAAARRLGEAVVRGTGMSDGITSVEFRYAAGGVPVLMEAMVRMPGDFIVDAVSIASGVDWFDAVLGILLGDEEPVPAAAARRSSAVLYVVAPHEGVLSGARLRELEGVEGVVAVRQRIPDGTRVAPPRASSDRLASVVLEAPDGDRLDDLLARVRRHVDELLVVTP